MAVRPSRGNDEKETAARVARRKDNISIKRGRNGAIAFTVFAESGIIVAP